ncbi:MAG TPA: DUF6240 domain-containing protein, partial [Mobilitalea sp.]|nr:DUF6240 domain-containing protein [Mobilitalea sp.]
MDNYIPYGAGKNMAVVNQLQPDQTKIDNNEGNQGLGALSVGQQIEGLVVSVDDNVTLDFGGHQIAASKEIMKDAVPGDVEMFRVEKLKNNVIELKLINKSTATSSRGSAVLRLNIDSLLFMGRKEQSTNANRKEKGIQDTNNIIDKIASDITLNDIAQIEKDGFQVEKLTVDGLYEAMKRAKEAKHHTSQSKKTSDQQSNTTGNGAVNKAGGKVSKQQVSMNEKEVAGRLTEGNVPATKENVQNVMTALGQSNAVSKMDDRTMKYLISNELEPTIGNIYKACYSQNSNKQEQVQPLSDKAWNDLKPQVAQVISDAGFEVNDANLNTGKWLIENKLPVTQQSFTYKKELDDMKSSVDQNKVLDKVVDGMKEGISPKEVSLKTNTDIPHGQLLSDIHKIKDNTILYAVHEKSDLTIKNLMRIQNNDMKDPSVMKEYEGRTIDTTSLPEDSSSSEITGQSMDLPSDQDTMNSAKNITNDTEESTNITDDPSKASNGTTDNSDQSPDNSAEDKNLPIEAVKAKRQLEEIRLKMTAESATKLEKMGIQVDTQRLEKVVEALRELEDNYYKGLLKEADAVTSQENVQVLKETTQSVEQLKSIPSFILGATLPQRSIQTIPNLLSEGSSLQAQLTKAGTAYETLMTVPSKEYGDSIQKAFRNMESMLSEMNIENTQLNQRAVRILGYNQMDITQENIDQVKAYDMQV